MYPLCAESRHVRRTSRCPLSANSRHAIWQGSCRASQNCRGDSITLWVTSVGKVPSIRLSIKQQSSRIQSTRLSLNQRASGHCDCSFYLAISGSTNNSGGIIGPFSHMYRGDAVAFAFLRLRILVYLQRSIPSKEAAGTSPHGLTGKMQVRATQAPQLTLSLNAK